MIKRQLQTHLQGVFKKYPIVTLTGPRQSGKTTLCKATFTDLPYVNLETLDKRQYAIEDPRGFLAQFPNGAILDEFQKTPDLPSYLQEIVDNDGRNSLFVLTGSQNLLLTNTVSQSLAGRTAMLSLMPLSVAEIIGSKKPEEVNNLIFTGGYPRIYDQGLSPTQAISDYIATYVERDIKELSNIESLSEFRRFLQLCAGRVGQLINYQNLGNEAGVSGTTIKKWISLLEATFIGFNLRPYYRNVSKRVTKSPKFFFYDTGLACYLLGIDSAEQLNSHPLRGSLFENLVVLECLKHRLNGGKSNNLFFYRDSNGNEVDVVFERALDPVLVEAKFSKTLSKSFTKGFRSFIESTNFTESDQVLVYQGEVANSAYGMNVTNIQLLKDILISMKI